MKSLLTSVLVPAVVGNPSYEVYSCNNKVTRVSTDREIHFVQKYKKTFFQQPVISFRISADYFENNLNDPNNDYTFNNGYYERTVEESDLDFAFGENDRESLI